MVEKKKSIKKKAEKETDRDEDDECTTYRGDKNGNTTVVSENQRFFDSVTLIPVLIMSAKNPKIASTKC